MGRGRSGGESAGDLAAAAVWRGGGVCGSRLLFAGGGRRLVELGGGLQMGEAAGLV